MDSNEWSRLWLQFTTRFNAAWKAKDDFFSQYYDTVTNFLRDPSLEDTLHEKIGGGPHGYGDPADTSLREEEKYLFPPMIWRKVRYEKCLDVTEKFYNCVNQCRLGQEEVECKTAEIAMHECKSSYYNPAKIDEVENECIQEYIKLRSKFRESGSEEDLWKMKMMLLAPKYDKLRQLKKDQSK
ncbi:uncharacterized protein LOC113212607 [Frankliniella occidentalis]|uniref:COX assembly mitochondrial protein n=1 Tax=Frankliniella occidentalis TaxID=133901 RepID=A0A6J1T0W7_FRAOC|nr:uncharacterized protein LOC113212607 [Frankliniella occidentalis]